MAEQGFWSGGKFGVGGGGGWERRMLRCFSKANEKVVSRGWCREVNGTVNTTG